MQALAPRLAGGELDLAVIADHPAQSPAAGDRLRRVPLFDDRYQAILPSGHRLARRRTLALTDLAEDAWVGGHADSAWFGIVRQACRAAGFEPRAVLGSDDYRAVQAFVAAGLGVAVLPGLAVAAPMAGVEVRALRGGSPVRRVAVAYPDDGFQPAAVRAMTAILQDVTRARRARRRA